MLGIITLHTPDIKEYADITANVNRSYAEKYGYVFIEYNNTLFTGRKPHWSKILAIKANLPMFDWLMWIDADACVANPDISIETFLNNNYNIIIGDDPQTYINSGVFFIKNDYYSFDILDKMWSDEEQANEAIKRDIWHEQSALVKLLKEDVSIADKVKIVDKKLFNSFYQTDYQDGDLIVHCPGTSIEERIKIFKNFIGL